MLEYATRISLGEKQVFFCSLKDFSLQELLDVTREEFPGVPTAALKFFTWHRDILVILIHPQPPGLKKMEWSEILRQSP